MPAFHINQLFVKLVHVHIMIIPSRFTPIHPVAPQKRKGGHSFTAGQQENKERQGALISPSLLSLPLRPSSAAFFVRLHGQLVSQDIRPHSTIPLSC